MATLKLKQGDQVRLPWGLDEVVGKVVEVYGPAGHRSVLVEVPVEGASGEELETTQVSMPESALTPVDGAPSAAP